MRYPGGKGKCYQQIINLLPPHSTYIETHLGGGAVLRNKKAALENIGIDRDLAVIRLWRQLFPHLASYRVADAVDFLESRRFDGNEVVYSDPPYLPQTRRRARVYRHDYTENDHQRLLQALRGLRCNAIVSGYPSEMYDDFLRGWNTCVFPAKANDSLRCEKLWFNFKPPNRLHDARYIGANFRERQTVKRRLERLKRRILSLSPQVQHQVSEWLVNHLCGGCQSSLEMSPLLAP